MNDFLLASLRRPRVMKGLCSLTLLMFSLVTLGQEPGQRSDTRDPGMLIDPSMAQEPPSPPPDGRRQHSPPPGPSPCGSGMTQSTMRGGLQLGPPGLWWDDDEFSRSIGLQRDQQQRMDAIFLSNKSKLQSSYKALQHEELQLEIMTRAKVVDEKQIFAQIDRVVAGRGELEKANAHMLLKIRAIMSAEQIERLDSHRPIEIPSQ